MKSLSLVALSLMMILSASTTFAKKKGGGELQTLACGAGDSGHLVATSHLTAPMSALGGGDSGIVITQVRGMRVQSQIAHISGPRAIALFQSLSGQSGPVHVEGTPDGSFKGKQVADAKGNPLLQCTYKNGVGGPENFECNLFLHTGL